MVFILSGSDGILEALQCQGRRFAGTHSEAQVALRSSGACTWTEVPFSEFPIGTRIPESEGIIKQQMIIDNIGVGWDVRQVQNYSRQREADLPPSLQVRCVRSEFQAENHAARLRSKTKQARKEVIIAEKKWRALRLGVLSGERPGRLHKPKCYRENDTSG